MRNEESQRSHHFEWHSRFEPRCMCFQSPPVFADLCSLIELPLFHGAWIKFHRETTYSGGSFFLSLVFKTWCPKGEGGKWLQYPPGLPPFIKHFWGDQRHETQKVVSLHHPSQNAQAEQLCLCGDCGDRDRCPQRCRWRSKPRWTLVCKVKGRPLLAHATLFLPYTEGQQMAPELKSLHCYSQAA